MANDGFDKVILNASIGQPSGHGVAEAVEGLAPLFYSNTAEVVGKPRAEAVAPISPVWGDVRE